MAWPQAASEKETTYEERIPPSASDFGGIGLLQTRTARFGPDGQFDVGVSQVFPYRRYYLNLTGLPWLEGTFRYSDIRNVFENTFGVNRTFKDRGADLKLRVAQEGNYRPAIAVGLQDGLGTGQFGGEYVVLSKRYFDFDFSLGMGWGYFAGRHGALRNPLVSISDQFKVRSGASARGGTFNIGNYFSGERVTLFGGVEYQTPIAGLSVKVEYDGNDFDNEPLGNRISRSTPLNVGVNYRPYAWVDLSTAYERGDTVMARASLRYNFNDPSAGIPKFLDPPPPPLVPRRRAAIATAFPDAVMSAAARSASRIDRTNGDNEANALLDSFERAGYEVAALDFVREEARVFVAPNARQPNLGAIEAFLAEAGDVQKLSIVPVGDAVANAVVSYDREGVARSLAVERLFGLAEASGLSVSGIELSRRALFVHVRNADRPASDDGDVWMAQTVGQIFNRWADAVTIVAHGEVGEITKTTVVTAESTETNAAASGVNASTDGSVPVPSRADAAKKMFTELNAQDITVYGLRLSTTRATVFITPRRYRELARNLGRAARVVANNVPAEVEEISLAVVSGGMTTSQITILRKDLENAVSHVGSVDEIWANATFGTPAPTGAEAIFEPPSLYPNFRFGFRPRVTQLIGDAAKFVLIGVVAGLDANIDIAPGLGITAALGYDVLNNFDDIKVDSDSTLPHVRSDLKFYLQQRSYFIERLQADYLFSPFDEFYARVSAGIFEWMYGGYSVEVLYRPFESRWALGADVNRVRQRAFDQMFEFREPRYEVTTGHVNLYYDIPYYDLLGSVHVGQFLAKDVGASFRLSRLFESGIQFGAWATLTNVSTEEFGEGSFDKGFFLSVPFQLFFPRSSPTTGTFAFRPLTRDGGQMVGVGKRLYDVTGAGYLGAFSKDWNRWLD